MRLIDKLLLSRDINNGSTHWLDYSYQFRIHCSQLQRIRCIALTSEEDLK